MADMKICDVKVTVMKRSLNKELIAKYGKTMMNQCEVFKEGDEFMVKGINKPDRFCSWAWADIQRDVAIVALGGNFFGTGGLAIVCCTDGYRPVVFKLQRIES